MVFIGEVISEKDGQFRGGEVWGVALCMCDLEEVHKPLHSQIPAEIQEQIQCFRSPV